VKLFPRNTKSCFNGPNIWYFLIKIEIYLTQLSSPPINDIELRSQGKLKIKKQPNKQTKNNLFESLQTRFNPIESTPIPIPELIRSNRLKLAWSAQICYIDCSFIHFWSNLIWLRQFNWVDSIELTELIAKMAFWPNFKLIRPKLSPNQIRMESIWSG